MALAFCMGTDLQGLANSDQPMAQIFLNSFGHKGTLAIWVFVVLIQYASLPRRLKPINTVLDT